MRKPSSWLMLVVAIVLGLISTAAGDDQSKSQSQPADQTPATPPYAILHAPAGVKEGEKWIPELPKPETLAPPPGWKPDGHEVPWMPATLLRLPRTNITRAKFPAIDFHNHTGVLTTKEQYERVISILDRVGIGAIVNLNAGTEDQLEAVLKAGEPYKDRVANFLTFNPAGINEPGWSERFAAIMERGFKAGAMGMKVFKSLSTGVQNPDGSYIQMDDPRLDAIWEMCAKYKKPIMIHTGDSIGRFYPIGPANERYEAGLWHQPGDTSGNLYKNGPTTEQIEKARENAHRKHPNTTFVNAHLAMLYYDPAKLSKLLDTYPNAQVELSATVQDLGRAPRLWREFIIKYQDRVLFGTDGNGNSDPDTFWNPHFRYLETYDEYFEHPAQIRTPGGSPGHGRWNISGIGLPPEVLRKVYYENALKYLPSLRPSITRQLAARR